jgi:cell fate (sporulation/competence/biofilm development) regulator YmcA (YheA/YmcA/DUF963 family)
MEDNLLLLLRNIKDYTERLNTVEEQLSDDSARGEQVEVWKEYKKQILNKLNYYKDKAAKQRKSDKGEEWGLKHKN